MQQLPVIESVKDAIGYTMSNITLLVKASMFWVAIYTVFVGIFSFLGGEAYLQIISNFFENTASANPEAQYAAFISFIEQLSAMGSLVNWLHLVMILVGIVAYYSIAIAWHRACLLDEVPPLVRLGKLEFKYFGYTILLGLVLYIIFVVIGLVIGFILAMLSNDAAATSIYPVIGLLSILLFLAFGRFTLVFPGIAVRDRRMSFRTSWAATKGNSWRILGGTIMCILPALVISLIASLISAVSLPLVISLPIIMILQLLSGAFLLSFMSICYQFLVPSPDEGDLA
ncbi:MAG: hypothetical protein COB24_07330 [Hyphomicrobiales bacterium]|nr:MAG: hypothetical protein COB24_07330 [Hyphomicrobiales bacterium]